MEENTTNAFLTAESEENPNFGFFALNIVKTGAKEIFAQDNSLLCLIKSESFLKELLNTYNKLFSYNIKADLFFDIVKNSDISPADKNRLESIAKLYGYYIDTMTKNNYKIPGFKQAFIKKEANEISFLKTLRQFQNYFLIEFSDVQNECFYITQEIKNLVEQGVANYCDFAVFADKSEMRRKLSDMLKSFGVPVFGNIYNENYENLKHKLSLFHNISQILEKLGCSEFSSSGLKNPNIESKALKEILFENLDEYIKTLLENNISDIYALEKLYIKNENSQKALSETVFAAVQNLNEQDKTSIFGELGLLKRFYDLYSQKQYAKAIALVVNSSLSSFNDNELKKMIAKKSQSLEVLQNLYDGVLKAKPDFEAFYDIMEWLGLDNSNKDNAVTLESISALPSQGKKFKYIYLAGLTENNFPGTNPSYPFISKETDSVISSSLKKLAKDFDGFVKTDETYYAQRMSSVLNLTNKAAEKITLTTHAYEAKKQVQPSSIFKMAKQADCSKYTFAAEPESPDKFTEQNIKILGDSSETLTVIDKSDILKLNASAISTFQSCPRKYFYKNLLNLKEPSTFSASYGSVVHAVFEVMNNNFLDKYTKETAAALSDVLFNAKNIPQKALQAGFKQTDIDLICAAADLSLAEMKDNFLNAIEDFSLSGGFDNPPVSAVCEKSFTFKLPELPDIVFDGRIDAILCGKNGEYQIIDYKTGRDKTNTLDYAISEYGVNFLSRTGKEPANPETLQNAYDYQIPLYYFACLYSPELSEYKDKISKLGLLYIRPSSKDNGCSEDFISAERINFFKEKIIQNLKTTVIDKIVNETEFKKNKSFACENCAYKFLCDTEDDDE